MSVAAAVADAPAAVRRRGAPKKANALTAQINARIDADVKASAEAAFARAGVGSSEVIRAVYARAAQLGTGFGGIEDLLSADAPASAEQDERVRRRAVFERTSSSLGRAAAAHGITMRAGTRLGEVPPMTEEEVEEAIYQDFLAEGALR